jgi:hypothetical protein
MGKRPDSPASAKTFKSIQSSKTTALTIPEHFPIASNQDVRRLHVKLGMAIVAERSAPKSHKVRLLVERGDSIQVLKHVSGALHHGKNLRTGAVGQFSESIFTPSDETLARQRNMVMLKAAEERLAAKKAAEQKEADRLAAARRALDQVENTNAAAWDEVPVRKAKSTALVVGPQAISSGKGLAASKSSSLEGLGENKQVVVYQNQQNITPAMQAEFGKIVDMKVDILSIS